MHFSWVTGLASRRSHQFVFRFDLSFYLVTTQPNPFLILDGGWKAVTAARSADSTKSRNQSQTPKFKVPPPAALTSAYRSNSNYMCKLHVKWALLRWPVNTVELDTLEKNEALWCLFGVIKAFILIKVIILFHPA